MSTPETSHATADRRRLLEQRLRSGIDALTRQRRGGGGKATVLGSPDERPRTADDVFQPFPLTDMQEAYWLGRQQLVALGEVACHAYVELRGTRFDPARFASGWRQAISRHPVLREVIDTDGVQRVLDGEIPFAIATTDLGHLSPAEAEAEVAGLRRRMSHQVLPLDRAPLFDVRVTRIADLADAVRRVARGETVIDPEVVGRLLGRPRRHSPLDELTRREREILGLMAEGRSNHGIAEALTLELKTVEGHVGQIFSKLGLEQSGGEHRRVLAVLTFLRAE